MFVAKPPIKKLYLYKSSRMKAIINFHPGADFLIFNFSVFYMLFSLGKRPNKFRNGFILPDDLNFRIYYFAKGFLENTAC